MLLVNCDTLNVTNLEFIFLFIYIDMVHTKSCKFNQLYYLNFVFLSGQVKDDDVVDSNIMPYCSLDKQEKKTIGEMEQDFLLALQVKPSFLSSFPSFHFKFFMKCITY